MTTETNQRALKELWQRGLSEYRQEGLRTRLEAKWPGDPNVAQLSFAYPPTFQPGYVGQRYFKARVQLVLLLRNPGEGRSEEHQRSNDDYLAQLEAFSRGELGFEELNARIAKHALSWGVYGGKGIFQEDRGVRVPLISKDVRPSISEVACLNYFPFKTSGDAKPRMRSSFLEYVWKTHVRRALELLEPTVLVRVPDTGSRQSFPKHPEPLEVPHPRARFGYYELEQRWRPVTDELRRLGR